ncbi:hypothetical protein ABDK56_02070 [Sphingomonas sp. ASV193]|uniref:hypothetical protein n=1 Tax=Sphingomonas sp. ASV193 TaxID=3144405 RepID=UPI0032E88C68
MDISRIGVATAMAVALIAASSAPVAPGNRMAYCRGEVSSMYGTKPLYVKTGRLLRARDGTTSVSGTADKGSEGIKKFKCRYDKRGRFIDVLAMTPDGE